jgi:biopolymer transport protein ExbD
VNVWKVRHEGSPVASADLTFEQVLQGLVDGKLSPEDEVKGPTDANWLKLEDHPAFAEIAAEMEPEPEVHEDEETNLDMNPLIDVALVLLIFFILTTTYSQLQKIIAAADASREGPARTRVVKPEEAKATTIQVKVTQAGNKTTIEVEKEVVAPRDLVNVLTRHARDPNRRTLLLQHDRKVPHGVMVQIQDDAKTAGIDKVAIVVGVEQAPAP